MKVLTRLIVAAMILSVSAAAGAQDDLFAGDELTDSEESSAPSEPAGDVLESEDSPDMDITAPGPAENPGTDEGEEVSGFELGINVSGSNRVYSVGGPTSSGWTWAGGSAPKIAFQPGWCFGRVGVYLLTGFDYRKDKETAETFNAELENYQSPSEGTQVHQNWSEKVTIDAGIFTYDIGVGVRIFLLEALREMSANLYLEFDIGWRGAVVSTDMKWEYMGSPAEIPSDTNNDGDRDGNDILNHEFERSRTWDEAAQDWADALAERYNGLWVNLGLGGEYVFAGGFGVGAEAGLSLFGSQWKDKSNFGYDSAGEIGSVFWTYENEKWKGTRLDFGVYYSIGLRYHF